MVHEDSKIVQEVFKCFKKVQKFEVGSSRFKKVQEGSRRFKKFPEGSGRSKKVKM